MNVTLLGGGSEIGASCLHIEMSGTRLLFDAGMRMHHDDPMPALGMLHELGGIDALLVTHAHADHIGALPFVKALYPEAPVYATPPTADLMRVMMRDSFRILESRCRQENRLVPYTEDQMNILLQSVLAFPASGTLTIGNIELTAYRAGHILGAVMFELYDGKERLLLTGDLSFRAGRTIPGAKVPYGVKPDVVIMESTYGNRAHTDRNMEEKRLAENVAEVVSTGGFALIPAFALGRSQEILLILQDYMDRGLIPSFPIYVDGMVTPICRIYRDYPQYLKGPVAHRIRQTGDAFLNGQQCVAVQDVAHREMLLQGKPGCIVASSGMLIGGASLWYAERLIEGENNAIFITGYQDEESPGRKLLALSEGLERTLEINGTMRQVRCRIDKYGLSAHADAMEMTRFIEQLGPVRTLLVHGDDEARRALAAAIPVRYGPILPDNGTTYTFDTRGAGQGVKGKRYNAAAEQISALDRWIGQILLLRDDQLQLYPAICLGVHAKTRTLNCQTFRKSATVKIMLSEIVESLGAWNGPLAEAETLLQETARFSRPLLERLNLAALETARAYSLDEVCSVIGADTLDGRLAAAFALQSLPEACLYRVKDKDGFIETHYCLDETARDGLTNLTLPIQGLRVDPATALNTVRELLSDHPRFMRCGAESGNADTPALVIYFDFPDAVPEPERQAMASELRQRTGWEVLFSSSIRQDQLAQLARSLLGGALAANPSIRTDMKQLVVACEQPPDWAEMQEQFHRTTGYALVRKGQHAAGDGGAFAEAIAPPSDDFGPPLEINQAQQEVKRWMVEIGVTIYKASVHQMNGVQAMELHFISPQVAGRYMKEMEQLAYRIGRPVSFTRNPKQNEIIAAANALIPAAWGVVKNPSLHIEQALVSVKVPPGAQIDAAEIEDLSEQLHAQTGYRLRLG